MSELLTAALRYAGQGRPVFPCEPRGKRPATRNGLKDATTDVAQIGEWWRARPELNVAIRTGVVSRLLVLDVDGDAGTESLRELERQHGDLPRTASVTTPRGGEHFYFRHPGGDVPNSAGKLGAGLDIRGDGGYVLAPPSSGPNGRRYEPDERVALAESPAWLCERLTRPHGARQPTPTGEWLALVAGIPEGERNQSLARLTGHLLARDIDARLVRELILLLARHRCQPPLADDEAVRIVESIAGRELQKRGVR